MRKGLLFLVFAISLAGVCRAQQKDLLIDDLEGAVSSGPEGTFDYGTGGGSLLELSASTEVKNSGGQSIKMTYDAIPGGYMWFARGLGLDATNAAWLVKNTDIDWAKYSAISLYVYGSDSKATVAIDLKDSGNELWRYVVADDFKGWKRFVLPFKGFRARDDWQPEGADTNLKLDFPLKTYQVEVLPEAKGVLYVDTIELTNS